MLAAQSAGKGKGKKKKWSKGKMREKKQHRVVFTKSLLDQFMKEVPKKQKLITIYNLVENYKINCSLARRGIQELVTKGQISPVCPSGTYGVWTKTPETLAAEAKVRQVNSQRCLLLEICAARRLVVRMRMRCLRIARVLASVDRCVHHSAAHQTVALCTDCQCASQVSHGIALPSIVIKLRAINPIASSSRLLTFHTHIVLT